MAVGQPCLRMTAFQVFEGALVMVATVPSGTGVPKVYRVTQGLKQPFILLIYLVARDGIEPPTRGFSGPVKSTTY
jgi:hypothetical protein